MSCKSRLRASLVRMPDAASRSQSALSRHDVAKFTMSRRRAKGNALSRRSSCAFVPGALKRLGRRIPLEAYFATLPNIELWRMRATSRLDEFTCPSSARTSLMGRSVWPMPSSRARSSASVARVSDSRKNRLTAAKVFEKLPGLSLSHDRARAVCSSHASAVEEPRVPSLLRSPSDPSRNSSGYASMTLLRC